MIEGKVINEPSPATYCVLEPANPILILPLVVTGLPVIESAALDSVMPTDVTVPTYWSALDIVKLGYVPVIVVVPP